MILMELKHLFNINRSTNLTPSNPSTGNTYREDSPTLGRDLLQLAASAAGIADDDASTTYSVDSLSSPLTIALQLGSRTVAFSNSPPQTSCQKIRTEELRVTPLPNLTAKKPHQRRRNWTCPEYRKVMDQSTLLTWRALSRAIGCHQVVCRTRRRALLLLQGANPMVPGRALPIRIHTTQASLRKTPRSSRKRPLPVRVRRAMMRTNWTLTPWRRVIFKTIWARSETRSPWRAD